jgi:hypothetical protein
LVQVAVQAAQQVLLHVTVPGVQQELHRSMQNKHTVLVSGIHAEENTVACCTHVEDVI